MAKVEGSSEKIGEKASSSILDSGGSHQMVQWQKWIQWPTVLSEKSVVPGDGNTVSDASVGSMLLLLRGESVDYGDVIWKKMELHNVFYVTNLTVILLSWS